jgi:sporulation protein YlmC with PRC-barrel domain
MKRIRYHELVGKHVATTDGTSVGRVIDLAVEACGERLVVNALSVGPAAFFERIGFHAIRDVAKIKTVPWEAVVTIDRRIEVRPDWNRERDEEQEFERQPENRA